MSAIPNDAADILTKSPHPTGAATVININNVESNSTTNPATAPDPASAQTAASSSASNSRLESRDSALPSPRDFTLEQHQAEYRAHAYICNESTVATLTAGNTYLQSLFAGTATKDKDLLRAASAAGRARLQNPFAYNTSRSSGSSRQTADQAKHDAAENAIAHTRKTGFGFPDPELDKIPTPVRPHERDHSLAPYGSKADETDIAFFDHLSKQREALCPANMSAREADCAAAPLGSAIAGGPPFDPAAPSTSNNKTAHNPFDLTANLPPALAKIGPTSTLAAAAQANPLAPTAPDSTEAPPIPDAAPKLAILPFGDLAISPPTELEFQKLESSLTALSGRPFTINRTANIHDPATVAYFKDHALYIQNQLSMARAREAHFDQVCRTTWPHGP